MPTFLFWGLVIVLTIIVGALLPKILLVLIRIALYIVAFFLILWFFAKIGILPLPYGEQIKTILHNQEGKKKQETFANFRVTLAYSEAR